MALDEITARLIELREGRREALDQLLPLVYAELRAIARGRRGAAGRPETLGTTALVHEAYLRLAAQTRLTVNDRRHFFAVAATAMRQILVDHARRRRALKRGGGAAAVPLDEGAVGTPDRVAEILSLDEGLRRLAELDARLARVVELRFFGGLSVEETAEVVGVDARTVKRDWRKARALLYTMLEGEETA